eukprot:4904014-Alexandrium_andersonii.AAC.1
MCSLGQLLPKGAQKALGDKLELQTYAESLLFVQSRLGLEKHSVLAQEAASEAPDSVGSGALVPGAQGESGEAPDVQQLEAACCPLAARLQAGLAR